MKIILYGENSKEILTALAYVKSEHQVIGFSVEDNVEKTIYINCKSCLDILMPIKNPTNIKKIKLRIKIFFKHLLQLLEMNLIEEDDLKEIFELTENLLAYENTNIGTDPDFINKLDTLLEKTKILAFSILQKHNLISDISYAEIHPDMDHMLIILSGNPEIQTKYCLRLTDLENYIWRTFVERLYLMLQYESETEKENVERIALGMSYIRNGINFKRLKTRTFNLAAPGQDLYYNYAMYKYAKKNMPNLKFCYLEMSPYGLWYDMSKSKTKQSRCLSYIVQLKDAHNLPNGETYVKSFILQEEAYNQIFNNGLLEERYYPYL